MAPGGLWAVAVTGWAEVSVLLALRHGVEGAGGEACGTGQSGEVTFTKSPDAEGVVSSRW